jgi:hypothetical protein
MGILQLLDEVPEAITRSPAQLWSVLARSLGEQGSGGRTALAWRWALSGTCPSPVTVTAPAGRPPSRSEILAESGADAELARQGIDPGGDVMQARFVTSSTRSVDGYNPVVSKSTTANPDTPADPHPANTAHQPFRTALSLRG